jgi:hypothetical protein
MGEILNAAREGNQERVESLLKGDPALLFTTDDMGMTPMHMAG